MRRLLMGAVMLLAGVACETVSALNVSSCTVSGGSGIAFGTYDPSASIASPGVGTVTATCTGIGLFASWTISLDGGLHGSFAGRKMKGGAQFLTYNIYVDAAHTQVWGDGTAGTVLVTDSVPLFVGTAQFPSTAYGLIATHQDLAPGTYTDTITVTINY